MLIENDQIRDYKLRQQDQKRKSVDAFRGLNYQVIAAGDSYNDTSMLSAAHYGILFRAPQKVKEEFKQFPAVETYDELWTQIIGHL